jgi:predicted amidohydrolase
VVGCGLSERVTDEADDHGHDAIYNSVAVFGAEGELPAWYRKLHLFRMGRSVEGAVGGPDEAAVFSAGTAVVGVEIGGMRHGLSVCYDLRFAELYRRLRAEADAGGCGAEVLVNVTAWPAVRAGHWDVLTRARAVENQAWFVGVGRVGQDAGIAMAGRSRVVSPMGEVVAEGSADRAELIVAEIDAAAVSAFRALLPTESHRRRDVLG